MVLANSRPDSSFFLEIGSQQPRFDFTPILSNGFGPRGRNIGVFPLFSCHGAIDPGSARKRIR